MFLLQTTSHCFTIRTFAYTAVPPRTLPVITGIESFHIDSSVKKSHTAIPRVGVTELNSQKKQYRKKRKSDFNLNLIGPDEEMIQLAILLTTLAS